jgi:hypothetical protein
MRYRGWSSKDQFSNVPYSVLFVLFDGSHPLHNPTSPRLRGTQSYGGQAVNRLKHPQRSHYNSSGGLSLLVLNRSGEPYRKTLCRDDAIKGFFWVDNLFLVNSRTNDAKNVTKSTASLCPRWK